MKNFQPKFSLNFFFHIWCQRIFWLGQQKIVARMGLQKNLWPNIMTFGERGERRKCAIGETKRRGNKWRKEKEMEGIGWPKDSPKINTFPEQFPSFPLKYSMCKSLIYFLTIWSARRPAMDWADWRCIKMCRIDSLSFSSIRNGIPINFKNPLPPIIFSIHSFPQKYSFLPLAGLRVRRRISHPNLLNSGNESNILFTCS